MIKYEFAYADNLGKTLHISEVTEEIRSITNFYCNHPNCKGKMAAHINGKREKHFQHINYVEHDYETYLHENAKAVFEECYIDRIKSKKPFFMEYYENRICNGLFKKTGIKCELGKHIKKIDLTCLFSKIVKEKSFDSFRPDLRIYCKQKDISIFIEMKVTHGSTEKKLNSDNRIIEIKIENEKDIQNIKKCYLSVNDPKIRFYNFDVKTVEDYFCRGTDKGCRNFVEFFGLYKNGEYFLEEGSLGDFVSKLSYEYYGTLVYHAINQIPKGYSYYVNASRNNKMLSIIESLRERNLKIKDCNLCRYHALNSRKKTDKEIFCKFRKIKTHSDEACNCKYFRTF